MNRLRLPGLAMLLIAGSLVSAEPLSAQTSPLNAGLSSDGQFGFHLFQLLLEQKGLRSITEFDEAVIVAPPQTVIVLAGDLDWMSDQWAQIHYFIQQGGAVLVASDRTVSAPGLFELNAGPLRVNDEDAAYQQFRDCPVLTEIERHPVSRNVTQIVANRCGWISHASSRQLGGWELIARLSDFKATDQRGRERQYLGAPIVAELNADNGSRGRLILASDHSLFVNGMLWHGSNAMLAINTVDRLCDTGNRRTLFFSINGAASRSGIPMIPPESLPEPPEDTPLPPLDELMGDFWDLPMGSKFAIANALLTGLEDENVFNQVLANHAVELPAPEYDRQLYLTVAVLAGVWLLRQLMRRGRRFERPVSRNVVPAAESRVQDLVNSNDLLRPLRELAQDLFRTLTGSNDPKDWSVWPQTVGVSGLKRLEKIATNVDRRPVSRREFRRLVKKIENIRHMHESGQLTNPKQAAGRTNWKSLKERLRPATNQPEG